MHSRPVLPHLEAPKCRSQGSGEALKEATRVLRDAIAKSDTGVVYRAGAFNWNEAVLLTITDASFANETEVRGDDVLPR